MTIKEFLDKYYPPKNMGNAHQATWDLYEKIEETLCDDNINLETKKGSCLYSISTFLEICDKSIPDYGYLKSMLEDIEKL